MVFESLFFDTPWEFLFAAPTIIIGSWMLTVVKVKLWFHFKPVHFCYSTFFFNKYVLLSYVYWVVVFYFKYSSFSYYIFCLFRFNCFPIKSINRSLIHIASENKTFSISGLIELLCDIGLGWKELLWRSKRKFSRFPCDFLQTVFFESFCW